MRASQLIIAVTGISLFLSLSTPAATAGGFPSHNVTLLSQLDLSDFPGAPDRGNDCWGYVAPSGREYVLMGLYNEVAIVEITSPSDPVIIAEIPHTPSNWCDIKVYQDHAYAVNESGGGLDVIDLSQVDSGIATLVQRYTANGLQTCHNLAVDTTSGFLYLCDSNLNGGRLIALDVSNPAAPVFVGQISGTEGVDVHDAQIVTYPSGVYAGRQIAFAAVGGTGLDIYDVTDKSNMFRLSRSTYPNLSFHHQCWTGDLQHLYLNDELNGINESVIFDITDLTAPVFSGSYTAGLTAIDHNQYVHNGLIYETDYTAGLQIFDASDPLNPVRVGWFDTYPPSDAAATFGAWSNYPFFPSGNIVISTKDAGMFVVRLGPPPLAFSYPNGLPERVNPSGDSFIVDIVGQGGQVLDAATPTLHYEADGNVVDVPMTPIASGRFMASFGAIPCAAYVQFHVSATTTSGIRIKDPISAPAPSFNTTAAANLNVALDDDMESDHGWIVGAPDDTASRGIWTRVAPLGNGSAPQSDHTADPGTICYITGQEPPNSNDGDNDVDGGKTTLLTPVFDLGGAGAATVSYWRWYANDFFQIDGDEGNGPNEDVFVIDISNDGGGSWTNVETIGPAGPETSGDWILHSFNVADFVSPTAQVQLRFVASDFGNLSVVEAGIDDFRISIVSCTLAGDLNCDGLVTVADIGPSVLALTDPANYATQFPDCDINSADINDDGMVSVGDIGGFVALLTGG